MTQYVGCGRLEVVEQRVESAKDILEARMISKAELATGIRFAGERAAAAALNTKDWDHQLGHEWTSRAAFSHVAATAAGASRLYPALDGGTLSTLGVPQMAASNAKAIDRMADKSQEEIVQAIRSGHEESATFVESLDEADLAKVVSLGGYEMPKSEILAQIWIHHAIAHAYEASARWPLL
ncbi:MAG: maleylpyruvate isomerase N-terminal domain-containing protein [Tepidiformaceae bacterium]